MQPRAYYNDTDKYVCAWLMGYPAQWISTAPSETQSRRRSEQTSLQLSMKL